MLLCKDLSVRIGDVTVCRRLNLQFKPGQCWGILGRNGAGKTTLLHTLANLRKPQQGAVHLLDKPLTDWPRKPLAQQLGVLLQTDAHVFPTTVLEMALTGRHPHLSPWQSEAEADRALARAALAAVDLEGLAHRQVQSLSGGERQRLAIATLVVQAPQVFLLDEPTNHLDLHFQVTLLQKLVERVQQNRQLLVMTLHDVNLAARFCDHLLLLLGDGDVVFGPASDMLREDYLSRLYQHPIVKVQSHNRAVFLPE